MKEEVIELENDVIYWKQEYEKIKEVMERLKKSFFKKMMEKDEQIENLCIQVTVRKDESRHKIETSANLNSLHKIPSIITEPPIFTMVDS